MRFRLLLVLMLLLTGQAEAQRPSRPLAVPDSLDGYIEREMKERGIPGLALAIARNGQVLTERAYGLASVANGVPVRTGTRFALASLTKAFTSAGIMMLVEEGKVELDASITRYLADAPEGWSPVTIRHMLTHTSGLPAIGYGFSGAEGGIYNRIWISTEAAWEAAKGDTLHARPGDEYAYSDVAYFLLGMVIEEASGRTWREFIRERILDPLEMTETFILDQIGIHRDLAAGYTLRGGELTHLHRPWQFELPSHFGLFSTVGDLAKWDAALYGDGLLSAESRRQMWTAVRLNDGRSHPYGFGWQVDRPSGKLLLRHTGITGTEMVRIPEDTVAVIVLTNLGRGFGGSANAWGIARDIAEMLVPEISESAMPQSPAAPGGPSSRSGEGSPERPIHLERTVP